ncbi:hypothetical protein MMC07_008353 [Pseudocyphellaria aurata]|nr:hypothetical protein [Pseudocyphellaria aurata]
MRRLTLTRLFTFSKVYPTVSPALQIWSDKSIVPRADDITDFLDFIALHQLQIHIKSVVLYIPTQDWFPRCGDGFIDRLFLMIVEAINPEILTIMIPPLALSNLVPIALNMSDAWAFEMPMHVFRLTQPPRYAGPRPLPSLQSLHMLRVRPWNTFVINEGSSAKVYKTYEYYHKCTPSALQGGYFSNTLRSTLTTSFLKIFEYVAVFPLPSHVSQVIHFIQSLTSLDTLRTQIGSNSKSDIWGDSGTIGQSSPADLWMDYETNYGAIAGAVAEMGNEYHLKNFTALEYYYTPNLLANLDDIFERKLVGWRQCDRARWEKM